jgi:hypothetical protein
MSTPRILKIRNPPIITPIPLPPQRLILRPAHLARLGINIALELRRRTPPHIRVELVALWDWFGVPAARVGRLIDLRNRTVSSLTSVVFGCENAPVDSRCSCSKRSCSSLGRRGGAGPPKVLALRYSVWRQRARGVRTRWTAARCIVECVYVCSWMYVCGARSGLDGGSRG